VTRAVSAMGRGLRRSVARSMPKPYPTLILVPSSFRHAPTTAGPVLDCATPGTGETVKGSTANRDTDTLLVHSPPNFLPYPVVFRLPFASTSRLTAENIRSSNWMRSLMISFSQDW